MRSALVGGAIAMALVGCGNDQPLVEPPAPAKPVSLLGTWEATPPGGYKLRYVFRRDGTYRYSSVVRQEEPGGSSSFEIAARGTVAVRGRILELRPRSGTKERHDTSDPNGDYRRPLEKVPQRYEWSVRGTGQNAKLTLTIGGALAVTYRRR